MTLEQVSAFLDFTTWFVVTIVGLWIGWQLYLSARTV